MCQTVHALITGLGFVANIEIRSRLTGVCVTSFRGERRTIAAATCPPAVIPRLHETDVALPEALLLIASVVAPGWRMIPAEVCKQNIKRSQ